MAKHNLLRKLDVTNAFCPSDKSYIWKQDGNGLLLRVDKDQNKTWVARLFKDGKETKRGIGAYPSVSLKEARVARDSYKKQWMQGIDPSIEKKKAKYVIADTKALTFEKAYLETLKNRIEKNSSDKHIKRWVEAYNKYLKVPLASFPLAEIDDAILLAVLENVYGKAPSSAMKVKSQINVIYTHMKEKRLFKGNNPVNELKGNSLIAPPKTKHFKALDEHRVGSFLKDLYLEPNLVVKTFIYIQMVTALRTGSLSNARWSWLHTETNTLNIPSEFMKSRQPFRCPLPVQVIPKLESLKTLLNGKAKEYIFEGKNKDTPISDAVGRLTIQRITGDKTTAHGFRTLYSRVVSKMNRFDTEKIESQLTHAFTKTDIRKVYLGDEDFLDDRRIIVQAYADWCDIQ